MDLGSYDVYLQHKHNLTYFFTWYLAAFILEWKCFLWSSHAVCEAQQEQTIILILHAYDAGWTRCGLVLMMVGLQLVKVYFWQMDSAKV